MSMNDANDKRLELSRREFMAKATIGAGGAMGLGLAIPIAGSLIPDAKAGGPRWTPLDKAGWNQLQTAEGAVQIDFAFNGKDAYLPDQKIEQSVWGIRVKDPKQFIRDRADLFTPDGKSKLPYEIYTMGFVLFSALCPHLNCPYSYHPDVKRFICPCHGSQYDENGAHIAGPAARGLDPLPLREHDGLAEVEWIRYQSTLPSRLVVSYIG